MLGLALFAWGFALPTADGPSPAAAVRASNQFGFALYARVKETGGNALCSPASASIALTMAAGGARGRTLAEMRTVLHHEAGDDPSQIHASFAALHDALNGHDGREGLSLQVANQLWGQNKFPFEEDFLGLLRVRYGAPLVTVDFITERERAAKTINDWAATQTHGRITDIIQPGILKETTRLVLTNALYFKGRWWSRFQRSATARRPFASAKGKTIVKMMRQQESFTYAKVDGLSLIELPYKGGLSMVVLLPDSATGLGELETRLAADYEGWLSALRRRVVDVELPRWRATSKLSLGHLLASMGMPSAFSDRADFSGMARAPLLIEHVLQQTFINVDEAGTEAAAVTAVVGGKASKSTVVPAVFHADHPFVYIIRDTETGAVLFVGRVVAPEGSSN